MAKAPGWLLFLVRLIAHGPDLYFCSPCLTSLWSQDCRIQRCERGSRAELQCDTDINTSHIYVIYLYSHILDMYIPHICDSHTYMMYIHLNDIYHALYTYIV